MLVLPTPSPVPTIPPEHKLSPRGLMIATLVLILMMALAFAASKRKN